MDRLTSMSIFVRVVQRGGFAATAKEIGISATMVAKHIQALEARLGARLLNRTTRRQGLTEAGKLYLDRCKLLLADVEAAESSVSVLRAAPRGTLRVTAPVSFGASRLAPALVKFLRTYPEVDVDLSLNDRVVDLVDEGFEAAIRIGTLGDSRLIARRLRPYGSLLCAAPDYLRRRGLPRRPEDLAEHDCLGFAPAGRRGRWRFVRGAQERTVHFVPRLLVNNGQALRQAALAGMGILNQPEVLVADDVRLGRLRRVLPAWSSPTRPMHIVYGGDRQASPKLQAFIAFVVDQFGAA